MKLNILSALIFMLAVGGSASAIDPTDYVEPDCTNNGIFVQISGGSGEFNCDGACLNNGVVIQLSPDSSMNCSECTNNGVMVTGPGNGCYAGRLPRACVENHCTPKSTCIQVCEQKTQQNVNAPCAVYAKPIAVECGGGDSCSVIQEPSCWTIRFGCTVANNQTRLVEMADERGIHCRTWENYEQHVQGEQQ